MKRNATHRTRPFHGRFHCRKQWPRNKLRPGVKRVKSRKGLLHQPGSRESTGSGQVLVCGPENSPFSPGGPKSLPRANFASVNPCVNSVKSVTSRVREGLA